MGEKVNRESASQRDCPHRLFALVLTAFAVPIALPLPATGQIWRDHPHAVIYLGNLGENQGKARGVNKSALLVGHSDLVGGDWHGFHWFNGRMVDIGTLGGTDSEARAINDLNQIVGWAEIPGETDRAFFWDSGEMIDLGTFIGTGQSEAYGINNLSQVVGWSDYIEGEVSNRGFFWEPGGELVQLAPINAEYWSEAYDINDFGEIVGSSIGFDGHWRATYWADENSPPEDLGSLLDQGRSWAIAVNDFGQIVGQSDALGSLHPCLWEPNHAAIIDLLDLPDFVVGSAHGINNSGAVTGWVKREEDRDNSAFLWTAETGMVLLNTLQPPRSPWHLELGWDINDHGQIAGHGKYGGGMGRFDHQPFLLTPVYPSFDLGEAQPGIGGQVNAITASNLEPGTRVYFVWGTRGGGRLIPGCNVQTNALQIDRPGVAGRAVADENGHATLEGMVPPIVSGQTLLFQAVVPNECAISNLVVQRFE